MDTWSAAEMCCTAAAAGRPSVLAAPLIPPIIKDISSFPGRQPDHPHRGTMTPASDLVLHRTRAA